MPANQAARRFFFLLLTGAAVLMALVVRPLATALFMAIVLAAVLWKVYRKLSARLRDRRTIASGLVVLGVVLLLVTPLAALSAFIVKEGGEGLQFVSTQVRSEGVTNLVKKLPAPFEKLATEILAHVPAPEAFAEVSAEDATGKDSTEKRSGEEESTAQDARPETANEKQNDQLLAAGGKAAVVVGAAARATGSLIFQTVMMLIALFFMLLHGEELVAWLDGVLPLPHGQTRELLTEFKTVSYSVVVSTIVTSAVQALAALIGYLIAQAPHPLFFAALTFFVAFIPAIGAASVCLLVALFLFTTGHPYMALFLVTWGLVVVGLVDNLVKPILIKTGMKMSGAIVFFSLIGGLSAFGTAGLLIGPLVVAFFLALLRIYQRDFKQPRQPRAA